MNYTIVVAWLDAEMVHDGRPYARDLGAAPAMRMQVRPHACMWLNKGTADDIERAREYLARTEPDTGRVYVYDLNQKEPLKQAREDVLAGKSGR